MNREDVNGQKTFSLSVLLFNLGVFAIYGLTISPMLRSGFLADDRFDSVWASVRSPNGVSALADGLYWTQIYQNSLGRFHPLAHIIGALFFEISDLSTAKTLSFLLTVLVVALIAVGLNLWLNSRTIGGLFVLILTAVSQFRPTFDPLLSFGVHTKLLVMFAGGLFVSIGMISRDCRLRWAAYAFVNLFCLALSLYHELAVAVIVSALILCRSLDRKDRRMLSANLIWWIGAYFLSRFFLYSAIDKSITPPFYQLDLSPLSVLQGYLVQLSGLMPYAQLTHFNRLDLVPSLLEIVTGILTIFGIVYFLGRRKIEKSESSLSLFSFSSPVGSLIYFGVTIVILPPFFTALSSGMQMWTKWWDGYLQVWIGEIGLAVVAVAILSHYSKMSAMNHSKKVLLGSVLGILITFTGMANRNAVDNSPYWETNTAAMGWSRSISENAIKAGILDSKYLAGDVVSMPPRPWLSNDYIKVLNQRSVRIQNQWLRFADSPSVLFRDCKRIEDIKSLKFSNCGMVTENGFFVYAQGFHNGFAILAQPISLTISKDVPGQQLQVREVVEIKEGYVFIAQNRGCHRVMGKALDGFQVEVKLTRTGNQDLYHFVANDVFVAGSINTNSCLS